MRIKILGCYGGAIPGHWTTNFLVNDSIAVDAGALSFSLTFERQLAIRHIFITHSHLDHTNSLPFLIDNVFGLIDKPVNVYSIQPVIDSIRQHLFNDVTWPDFSRIPDPDRSILKFNVIEPGQKVTVDGITFTPVPVNHIVPCVGYLIDDGTSSVLFSSDTGPCEKLYEVANQTANLRALITEVSFPEELSEIATLSGHLSPSSFAKEIARLERKVDVLLYHLKPPYIEQLHREIAALGLDFVQCLHQDQVYEY